MRLLAGFFFLRVEMRKRIVLGFGSEFDNLATTVYSTCYKIHKLWWAICCGQRGTQDETEQRCYIKRASRRKRAYSCIQFFSSFVLFCLHDAGRPCS